MCLILNFFLVCDGLKDFKSYLSFYLFIGMINFFSFNLNVYLLSSEVWRDRLGTSVTV